MLASDAVLYAYREAAIKRIGATLTSDEQAEGLRRLNGFLFSLFGQELGEQLVDVQVPAKQRATTNPANPIALGYPENLNGFDQPYEPWADTNVGQITLPGNVRLVYRATTATTVYLPEYPCDGARIGLADGGASGALTLHANGRKIEGSATKVLTTPITASEWFYRADLANWIPIGPLTLASDTPLPQEFDDLLVSGTAIRLTALDQIEPTKGTMMIYDRLLKRCKQRYTQRATTTYGGQNLPEAVQSFDSYGGREW